MKFNNICCLGGDVFGRAMCIVIAFKCPEIRVIILDDEKTISGQTSDSYTIFVPEFLEILKKCQNRNLFYSSSYESAIKESDFIFLTVKVPMKKFKSRKMVIMDFKDLEETAKLIALYSESDKIVVELTGVPVEAIEPISRVLTTNSKTKFLFDILSLPSYINENSTIEEILEPVRVVIGCHHTKGRAAAQKLHEVYEYWVPKSNILTVGYASAGYRVVLNAFLAQKQCSVSALKAICEDTGADFSKILTVLGLEPSLSHIHDIEAFEENISNVSLMFGVIPINAVPEYWEYIITLNEFLIRRSFERMKTFLGSVKGQEITVWGFKANIKKKKKPPIMLLCEWLFLENSNLRIYCHDDQSHQQILKDLSLEDVDEKEINIQFFTDKYLSIHDSLALVICFDKKEFCDMDVAKIVKWMKRPLMIDYYSVLDQEVLSASGVKYFSPGTKMKNDGNTSLNLHQS